MFQPATHYDWVGTGSRRAELAVGVAELPRCLGAAVRSVAGGAFARTRVSPLIGIVLAVLGLVAGLLAKLTKQKKG